MRVDPAVVNLLVVGIVGYVILLAVLPRFLSSLLNNLLTGLLKGLILFPIRLLVFVIQASCRLVATRNPAEVALDLGNFVEKVVDDFIGGFRK